MGEPAAMGMTELASAVTRHTREPRVTSTRKLAPVGALPSASHPSERTGPTRGLPNTRPPVQESQPQWGPFLVQGHGHERPSPSGNETCWGASSRGLDRASPGEGRF